VLHIKVSDACAGAACFLAGVSIAEIDMIVQIAAGSMAFIAGSITVYSKAREWFLLRRKKSD
jgi:hypothetical protein